VAVHGGTVELHHGAGRRLALATTADDVSLVRDPALSVWAPEYGRLERAATVVATTRGTTPFTIGTFIPAVTAGEEPVTITEILDESASPDWTESAFMVRTGRENLLLSVAFPRTPEAQPRNGWPQPCITRHRPVRMT
jgi:hypothetical protein